MKFTSIFLLVTLLAAVILATAEAGVVPEKERNEIRVVDAGKDNKRGGQYAQGIGRPYPPSYYYTYYEYYNYLNGRDFDDQTYNTSINAGLDRHATIECPFVRNPVARGLSNYRDKMLWNELPEGLRRGAVDCVLCGRVCGHLKESIEDYKVDKYYLNVVLHKL